MTRPRWQPRPPSFASAPGRRPLGQMQTLLGFSVPPTWDDVPLLVRQAGEELLEVAEH